MLPRLLFVFALAATSACLASTMRVNQTLSQDAGDLVTLHTIEIRTQSGDVLARGTFSEATNSPGKMQRSATLTTPETNIARGSATIEIDRVNGLSEEELIVQLSELPYPESCRLMADGRELTIFTTMPKGGMEFRLTRRVSPANVGNR